jgi:hypothetical protein
MPESRIGSVAVVLGGLTLASVVVILTVVGLDVVDPPDTFADNRAFSIWGLSIWATGMSALVTGLVALTRRHDRSWLVLAATLLGLLPVAMLLTEAAMGQV